MKTPIARALAYPERIAAGVEPLDFTKLEQLTFFKPDFKRYPCLKLAIEAGCAGQGECVILNAANEAAVEALAKYFNLSKADIYSVVSFYAQFKFTKPGKHTIKVCQGTACHVRGSGNLLKALKQRLGIEEGQTTPDGLISLEHVACLGACALAPAMVW